MPGLVTRDPGGRSSLLRIAISEDSLKFSKDTFEFVLFYQKFFEKREKNAWPCVRACVKYLKCVSVSHEMRESWKVWLTDFFDSSTTVSDKRKQNDSGAGGK